MRSFVLFALAGVMLVPACGYKEKAPPAAPSAGTGESAAPATAPVATPAATAKPSVAESCVAWSANEHPGAPKEGVCVGQAVSVQQGDCGHYLHVRNDAGQEGTFICWEPCEVLQDDKAPVWKGKRLRVHWKIGELAVAGHEQCKNAAAALAKDVRLVP